MASIFTGKYTGSGGAAAHITTGLVGKLNSVTITEVAARGPSARGYSTDAIQNFVSSGVFLNGDRKDTGIVFEGANFVVSNADLNVNGTAYYWEAIGD